MPNSKIFILLPDGVGLRNFAFTNFHEIGIENGFDITYWNSTPFDLTELGFKEIKVNSKPHSITDILKRVRSEIDLKLNFKKSGDAVYNSYRFPLPYKNFKIALKSSLVYLLSNLFSSENGVGKVRKWLKKIERKTNYYDKCFQTLKIEKPSLVFCTNQRPINAIAPILAAQDLGIPTATFIFSWDNLPKASMVVETDFYFVWSDHMKKELMYYYPFIKENQIFVTGTPQFERHTDNKILVGRNSFFEAHQLDLKKKYICYSGDDITTSPNDPEYLEDTVKAIRKLNDKGHQLGIVFRRCPVDVSNRFDEVLEKNKDIITVIAPKWENLGEVWNTILPTKDDLVLQINTIANTEMVINLGSSMVFDYVALQKPCAYINYDVPNAKFPDWSVAKIYNYIHFRTMPNKEAVLWINKSDEIAEIIESVLHNNKLFIAEAQNWFEKINQHPINETSMRIFNAIKTIINSSRFNN